MSDQLSPVINEATQLTVQSAARADAALGGNVFLVNMLAHRQGSTPPWWSVARDSYLRAFWKQSDHLAGAVYTMTSKMTAIPNKVVARNTAIKAHVEQAAFLTDVLAAATGIGGEGWVKTYGKFIEDLICTDNGGFMEVIGYGDPSGPILGQPVSVAHLDSSRCVRTGNAVYPVVYSDIDGKMYKLHFSRVMFASQQTSPIAEMYGVGFCAVSRCLNVAQTLIDIITFKQEKLGSRPHRQVLITQGGLDPSDLRLALQMAEQEMDNQGLTRFSKIVIGGSSTMPEADVSVINLAELPDGFNEETSITLGMAAIALAFGVDARELFPALTSGATRADALLQHLKQRGKGPGQILQDTEQLFNYKFLPRHLRFTFDFQDDAQDRQVAEIRKIRADRRIQDVTTNALNDRTLREQMFEDGDISVDQFDQMELEGGRLPDGSPVISLFYSDDKGIKAYLDLGVADPLDLEKNDPTKMLNKIGERRKDALTDLATTGSRTVLWNCQRSLAALDSLEMRYRSPDVFVKWNELPPPPMSPDLLGQTTPPGQGNNAATKKPGKSGYVDPRVRRLDLTQPTNRDTSPPADNLKPSNDDGEA